MQILFRQSLDRAQTPGPNIAITSAQIRHAFCGRHDSTELQPHCVHGNLERPSRITRLTKSLGVLAILAALSAPVLALGGTQSITLAWDQGADPTVIGYNLYHGVTSRTYTNMVDAGNATKATISGLVEGVTYFIAVTAYNILGLESDYSDELSYTVPRGPASVQLRVTPVRQAIVTVTGQVGHTYDILATQTFEVWTVLGTVTLGVSGSSEFMDPDAMNFPARFYRAQDTQP